MYILCLRSSFPSFMAKKKTLVIMCIYSDEQLKWIKGRIRDLNFYIDMSPLVSKILCSIF